MMFAKEFQSGITLSDLRELKPSNCRTSQLPTCTPKRGHSLLSCARLIATGAAAQGSAPVSKCRNRLSKQVFLSLASEPAARRQEAFYQRPRAQVSIGPLSSSRIYLKKKYIYRLKLSANWLLTLPGSLWEVFQRFSERSWCVSLQITIRGVQDENVDKCFSCCVVLCDSFSAQSAGRSRKFRSHPDT